MPRAFPCVYKHRQIVRGLRHCQFTSQEQLHVLTACLIPLETLLSSCSLLQHWIVSLIRHRKEKENFCFVIQACQLLVLVNTALSRGAGKQYLPSYFFLSTVSYILIISALTPISSEVPRILITSIWDLLTSQLFCNKLSRTRNLSI